MDNIIYVGMFAGSELAADVALLQTTQVIVRKKSNLSISPTRYFKSLCICRNQPGCEQLPAAADVAVERFSAVNSEIQLLLNGQSTCFLGMLAGFEHNRVQVVFLYLILYIWW